MFMPLPHEFNQDTRWFILFEERILLVREADKYEVPHSLLLEKLMPQLVRKHEVGVFNNYSCYCADLLSADAKPAQMDLFTLRQALEVLGNEWYHAAVKAYSIVNWDRNHQYCGRCSHLTVHQAGLFERICTHCKLAFYPRISPSVIVLIQRGDEILMARSPHFIKGAYGLIAGFVEVGESLEEAIHREVKEEVNIEIKNLRYFASQPWPFPDSLMVGFLADYASGDLHIDSREIEAADWYRYDNLPGRPSKMSLAKKMLDYYLSLQKK